jgi:predicted DNA-binding ribbon-helix-helix protein
MKTSVFKHSVVIDGHKTSISLEEPFWAALKNIAHSKQIKLSELVANIDATREGNLSSALRLFVLQSFRNEDKPNGSGETASFRAVRAERTSQYPRRLIY